MSRFGVLIALSLTLGCSAQVTGVFSLEKTAFAPREPVFLSFTMRNDGKEAEEVATADAYAFCSGYDLRVTRDGVTAPRCFRGYAGSCMSGAQLLAAGGTKAERLLLNYESDSRGEFGATIRTPGDYTVDALRDISYAPPGKVSIFFRAPNHRQEHQVLHFRVDEALSVSPASYERYVQQLVSKDDSLRREAALTLATVAPPALEAVLLGFATSEDSTIKQFAPLALTNLGTKASLAALAQMLLDNQPGTYEYMKAAEGLGRTHDPAWLPLLLEVADQHGAYYFGYAAEAGGEAAIPALVARLRTVDAGSRSNVIDALGETGSRGAVPILIGLLGVKVGQSEGDGLNDVLSANAALERLTHMSAEQGADGGSIPSWQGRWQRWWNGSGGTATIYKPEECVADTELP